MLLLCHPAADVSNPPTPLTPDLLRRLADGHYLDVYDHDFRWRGDLWKQVHESEDAFWRGDIIRLPPDDWVDFTGKPHSAVDGRTRCSKTCSSTPYSARASGGCA